MIHDIDEEIEIGIGNEWIVDNLCLSDNIMVSTPTNEPFFHLCWWTRVLTLFVNLLKMLT
jgi:hypothetical protein